MFHSSVIHSLWKYHAGLHVVPASWRCNVFNLIHGLSHPSIRTTRKIITSKFVWNGMQKQVGDWAKKSCIPCQTKDSQTHYKTPLQQFSIHCGRFDHIHVLPSSNGFTYFSCWPEAIPLNDITSATCAQALISHRIARFGIPIDRPVL